MSVEGIELPFQQNLVVLDSVMKSALSKKVKVVEHDIDVLCLAILELAHSEPSAVGPSRLAAG